MLLYLHHAWEHQLALDPHADQEALDAAIREGAVQRVRPKAMTVAVILAGLFPILLGHGAGSEVMQRIAAPMLGGMVTAPLLYILVIPQAYRLLCRHRLRKAGKTNDTLHHNHQRNGTKTNQLIPLPITDALFTTPAFPTPQTL